MRTALHRHIKPAPTSAPMRVAPMDAVPAPQPARPAPMHDISGVAIGETVQRKPSAGDTAQAYRAPNRTGLPDRLKAGVETLSGLSMDHVRVHRGSAQPAQLNAHAFTRGSDIHVAPGQERHLAHEAWHAVQQARGEVAPNASVTNVPINDDRGLERDADVMGARAARTDGPAVQSATSPLPAPRQPPSPAAVQRYVILGKEKAPKYYIGSPEYIKKLLTMDDYDEVLAQVMEYLRNLPNEADPEGGLSPTNVAVWQGLKTHAFRNRKLIAATLERWINARGELPSTMVGDDERAEWKQFDNVGELALALAHETHPDYQESMHQEAQLAGLINNDKWVQQQLALVVAKAEDYTKKNVSTFRWLIEPVDYRLLGSYNWGSRVTSLSSSFKSADKRGPSAPMSSTRASITGAITYLHDLMERWSSSGAGSLVNKVRDYLIAPVLPEAPDKAFESTVLDEEGSEFGPDLFPIIKTSRATKKVSQEEHDEVVDDITTKRAIRAAQKSLPYKAEIATLRARLLEAKQAMKKAAENNGDLSGLSSEIISLSLEIDKLESKVERREETRKTRMAGEGFDKFSFNDVRTPQEIVSGRAEEAKKLPAPDFLTAKLKESANERLKKVKVDNVDKSSKAKGRRNVGTRLENNPDTLLARMMSAPITAGRSMTTARMLQMVEMIGGNDQEKTAVAYALFAYWARTYNQGLTPVHTFHETLDVASNFGVPYKAFHYPSVHKGKLDLMNPGAYEPMSAKADQSGRWTEFRRLLDQVPRVDHGVQGVHGQVDESSSESKQQSTSEKSKPQSSELNLMYVSSSSQPHIPPSDFALRENAGGGDCLFYALEGHDLTDRELLDLRRQVADERRRMPARGNINAWNVAAALHQTPQTSAAAHGLMIGRDDVPNNVYAAMQEISGIYAGDDELVQYCRLRNISVAVVSFDGMLQIADANGIRNENYEQDEQAEAIRRIIAETDLALYKSPGHWELIEPAPRNKFESGLRRRVVGTQSDKLGSQGAEQVKPLSASSNLSKGKKKEKVD